MYIHNYTEQSKLELRELVGSAGQYTIMVSVVERERRKEREAQKEKNM